MEGAFLDLARDAIQDIFDQNVEEGDGLVTEIIDITVETVEDLAELVNDLRASGVKVLIISAIFVGGRWYVKLRLTQKAS